MDVDFKGLTPFEVHICFFKYVYHLLLLLITIIRKIP